MRLKRGYLVHNPIIKVEHLSYHYELSQQKHKALDDINLEIARGSCVAIIGFNGSGKSTLVQHFNGLLRPTKGSILVDGINVGDRRVDLRALRQQVGMLFQYPEAQLFEQTVFADVAFGPQRMHMSPHEVSSRVQSALDSVGLPHQHYGSRSPFELSGGQRRRVALAGIVAMSPTILILDEPTIGLDGEGRAQFYAHLQQIQQERGVTLIIVSHDMSEVAKMADWVFVLYQGRLMAQGTPRHIFTQEDRLREWGLSVPPLQELLSHLRQQGVPVPWDLLTVDEVFAFMQEQKHYFQLVDHQHRGEAAGIATSRSSNQLHRSTVNVNLLLNDNSELEETLKRPVVRIQSPPHASVEPPESYQVKKRELD
jgi:energy-coupling factor transport system ATP-binding protein